MARHSTAESLLLFVAAPFGALPRLRRELSGRATVHWALRHGSCDWLIVETTEPASLGEVRQILTSRLGRDALDTASRVVDLHRGGQIRVRAAHPVTNLSELSTMAAVGTPYVAALVRRDERHARDLTTRANTIAVVSDGTALQVGRIFEPLAALPYLESRALFFERLADISAVPLCANARGVDQLVDAIAALCTGFAAVCLAEVAAPRCFAVQQLLGARIALPVLHDAQEPAAIVVLAALANALAVVGKRLDAARIVIKGTGPTQIATARLLHAAGAASVVLCTSARHRLLGPAASLLPDAVHIATTNGASADHSARDRRMAETDAVITTEGQLRADGAPHDAAADPVVFLLDDHPTDASVRYLRKTAAVVATRSPSYPNHLDWALTYPALFRGLLDSDATTLSLEAQVTAARSLARLAEDPLDADRILPRVDQPGLVGAIASAIRDAGECTPTAPLQPWAASPGRA